MRNRSFERAAQEKEVPVNEAQFKIWRGGRCCKQSVFRCAYIDGQDDLYLCVKGEPSSIQGDEQGTTAPDINKEPPGRDCSGIGTDQIHIAETTDYS